MQIANNSNLLVARGAGGRGEALKSAPTPQGVKGVMAPLTRSCLIPQVLKLREVRPCRRPLPKSSSKVHQKSNQEMDQIFDPKWPPKGTLKITKI